MLPAIVMMRLVSASRPYQLRAHQLGVQPLVLQQLLVAALFNCHSAVQHDDAVGVANGGKPVGDDDSRAALHQIFQRVSQLALAHRVQVGGSLIQDQHRRVLQQGAGNGNPLPLTTRQCMPRSPTLVS